MSKPTEAQIKISEAMPSMAEGISEVIKMIAGTDMGFCLVVFNEMPDGFMSYISNIDREEAVEALKEFIEKCNSDEDSTPIHQREQKG